MVPPQKTVLMSFDCSLYITIPSRSHYHHFKFFGVSVMAPQSIWTSVMALTITASSFLGCVWWHLKFFGAVWDSILSFFGAACDCILNFWGAVCVCDGILSFLWLYVMAFSSTGWLPSSGSHLGAFSMVRSQFYRISKYFYGNATNI